MSISFLLVLDLHLLSVLILKVFVVVIRIVERILRNLKISDARLAAQQCLDSLLLLAGLVCLRFLEGVDLVVEGLDRFMDLARKGGAIVGMFLDFNGHFIMGKLVSFELTGNHFNRHQRIRRLQNYHEDSPSEVEHIRSVEDILLEDVAKEGSEQSNVGVALVDGQILSKCVRVVKQHDVVEGVLIVPLEVLSTIVEMYPSLEDEILDLVIVLIMILCYFCLDFRVDEQTAEVETRVMLDLIEFSLQEGEFLLIGEFGIDACLDDIKKEKGMIEGVEGDLHQ